MSSDGALEEIKDRLDIVEIISDYITLKRSGQNHKGLCPFHAEKTPSFMVSPSKQIFHCFGCGAGGDVFGFIMKHDNLSFAEAMTYLARKAGVELKPAKSGIKSIKEKLILIHKEAVKYFSDNLRKSETAGAYLKERGLTDETVKAFSLGYAPGGWHGLFGHLKGKGYDEPLLLQSGLIASGNKGPYDVFRERVIFPISDMQGQVIAFGGRTLGGGEPKYLNSPDTELFKKSTTLYAIDKAKNAIRAKREALIVEGYLDAIMCHQNGIGNAVAPLGTALTGSHIEGLIKRFECNLLLVFDGDEAGKSAARRSLDMILEKNIREKTRVSFLLLPDGEDPASFLHKKGNDNFMRLMSEAGTMVDFVLKTSGGDRIERIGRTVGLIAKVEDPLIRDELIKELSEKAGVRELTIREKLKAIKRPSALKGGKAAAPSPLNEEILLLSAMINVPDRVPGILEKVKPEDIRDKTVRAIFVRLAGETGGDAVEDDEERALVGRLSISPGFDPSKADKNIEDCIKKLLMRRMDEEIRRAEAEGDFKLLNRLIKQRTITAQGDG